jgi:cellulose synthase operon protein B
MEKEKMTRHQGIWHQVKTAWIVSVLFLGVTALLLAPPSQAQSRKSRSALAQLSSDSEAPASGQRVVSLTFKQMGAWSALKLRGVDGSRTLAFPIRTDEVVVAAKLRIAYDYSPALIPELSHLKILLNDRVAMIEALPQGKGLANAREIALDPRLFRDMNELRFTLIGHYTRQCEDPFHSSLWLSLSDLGRLELTLAPLSTVNDLKNLPVPFFDKRDNVPLSLPFVFASAPSLGTLKAAGVLASWFGQQAGVRGAQFPVSLNTLPDGNAVVFLMAGENLQGVKGVAASTLSIQPHPSNPYAKLLLVSGVNEAELARAARTIALLSPTLTGQTVTVTKEADSALRKPYDAPAWIRTDRVVKFGEIAKPEELRVQGYYPEMVRLNYRVPPDLFTWRTPGAPMRLKYRASRLPMHHSSSLNVNINSIIIDTLPLNELYDKAEAQSRPILPKTENKSLSDAALFIPPYAVSGRDQLQLGFSFDVIKEGECRNLPPDNLQASIDSESTLDFSSFPHYVALPNLSYFSSLGFPFTRMADLSETAVILPDRPNAEEMGMYLVLMGRMGEATGYPALRHEVITASEVEKMADRDLLVIGSANSQKLMGLWADRMPMVQIGGERRVREPNVSWRPTYRWEQKDIDPTSSTNSGLSLAGVGNLTSVMAFESPLKSARSVVFVYADKSADLRKIADLITDPERISALQGDFVVVDDKSVSHVKVGDTYYLGSLPWLSKLRWFFADQPLVLALIVLLIAVLMATVAYRPLRNLVAKRAKKTL